MTNVILAQLSSDSFCTALGITVTAAAPVLALCRKLIASSTYAPETPMNVYRGKTLCLRVLGIGEAAKLDINGNTRFTVSGRGNRRTASPIESEAE